MMEPLRENRGVRVVATILLAVSLTILCVLIPIHAVAFNLDFYQKQWQAHDVPADTGMSLEELSRSAQALWGYFTGRGGTPQVTVAVNGVPRLLYNDRELSHLVDVKSMFGIGLTLEQILAAEVVGIILYISRSRTWRTLSQALLISGIAVLTIITVLALSARTGFTDFWTKFHLLTFENDLWLLDPSTDWLIKMFPEGFFSATVARAGITAGVMSLAYIALSLLIRNLAANHRR